jgi:hypothetical protein
MRPLLEYLPEVQALVPQMKLSCGGSYLTADIGDWSIELLPWTPECGTSRWSCTIYSSQISRTGLGDTFTEAFLDGLHALDVAEKELEVQFAYLRGLPRKD